MVWHMIMTLSPIFKPLCPPPKMTSKTLQVGVKTLFVLPNFVILHISLEDSFITKYFIYWVFRLNEVFLKFFLVKENEIPKYIHLHKYYKSPWDHTTMITFRWSSNQSHLTHLRRNDNFIFIDIYLAMPFWKVFKIFTRQ